MTITHARRAGAGVIAALALLGPGAAQAQAHAVVSPPVALSGELQYFTLSVPTEKEGAVTTRIELDVPAGFTIDSYEPAPGWKREVSANKVIWTGGRVPAEEDAVFHFNASAAKARRYTFRVEQTYSDGSVVDWSGPESSDDPAPVVQAKSSLGGGGGGGGGDTVAVVAIIVAAVALLLSVLGLAGGRRPLT